MQWGHDATPDASRRYIMDMYSEEGKPDILAKTECTYDSSPLFHSSSPLGQRDRELKAKKRVSGTEVAGAERA